jgi:hypothetical protein
MSKTDPLQTFNSGFQMAAYARKADNRLAIRRLPPQSTSVITIDTSPLLDHSQVKEVCTSQKSVMGIT